MKRGRACAALAMTIVAAMPGATTAFGRGVEVGDGHFVGHVHFGGFDHGYREWGRGSRWGYDPAHYGPYDCWRWVAWPSWHRAWVCY